MMDQKIQAGVQSGSISQTDETALETALDSIDSATGVGSTSTAATPTNALDPSKVGDRIDDLIDEQVKAGKLTQDQANTLQALFAQNPPPPGGGNDASADGSDDMTTQSASSASGGGHVHGMHHHHKGAPPPTETADSDSDADDILSTITGTSTASSSTSSGSSSDSSSDSGATDQTKALDSLIAFLNNMRDKINSGGTYSASGSGSSASTNSTAATGLVVNSYA